MMFVSRSSAKPSRPSWSSTISFDAEVGTIQALMYSNLFKAALLLQQIPQGAQWNPTGRCQSSINTDFSPLKVQDNEQNSQIKLKTRLKKIIFINQLHPDYPKK